MVLIGTNVVYVVESAAGPSETVELEVTVRDLLAPLVVLEDASVLESANVLEDADPPIGPPKVLELLA